MSGKKVKAARRKIREELKNPNQTRMMNELVKLGAKGGTREKRRQYEIALQKKHPDIHGKLRRPTPVVDMSYKATEMRRMAFENYKRAQAEKEKAESEIKNGTVSIAGIMAPGEVSVIPNFAGEGNE